MGSSGDKSLVLVVLICCSTIVSIIGLILGAVSLSQGGAAQYNIYTQSSTSTGSSGSAINAGDDKVWMINIGHYSVNVEYLDEVTHTIRGYNVDVVDAVCDIANKNCELVWDVYQNCWDSSTGQRPRGGYGLMAGWFDACTGWLQTRERLLTFAFSTPMDQLSKVGLYVRNGSSSLTYDDLTSVSKVGFVDGWYGDEFCLARYDDIMGSQLRADQIMHFPNDLALIQAVNDGTVQMAFVTALPQFDEALMRVTPDDFENRCIVAGPSMMTRKNNQEFIRWWNDAFNRLVGTKRYDDICTDIGRTHGHQPGDHYRDICIGY